MEIFKLFGSVFIKDEEANKSLSKIDGKAEGVGSRLGSMIGTAAKWGAGLAAGAGIAVGGMLAIANKSAEAADMIDKLSERTGINREELQRWKYAADQSGADISKLEVGVKTLSDIMDQATNGNEKATEAFSQLGISVDDLKNKSQEDIFSEVMNALGDMEQGAARNALGNDLLGRSYVEMLPLLNAGSEGMEGLKNRADELGLVMSEEAVKANVKFGDTLADVRDSAGMIVNKIGTALLPILQQFLEWVLQYMPQIQATAGIVFGFLNDAISLAIEWVGKLISWLKQWLGENESTLATIQEKFMAFFEAVYGFIEGFIQLATEIWSRYGENILAVLETAWALISAVFETAFNILTDLFNVFAALFKGDWEELWEAVKSLFSNIWNGIGDILKASVDLLVEVIKLAWKRVSDVTSSIFEGIKDSILWIWDGILSGIKGYVNLIIKAVNLMIRGLNRISFSVPDWVPGIGGNSWGINIPDIPMLAKGGEILSGGSVMVGEAGPEILDLPSGAKVKPLDRVGEGGGGIVFGRGAFEGAIIFDDYGVDRMMDRVMERLAGLGVKPSS
jgi:hypothetical protein